MATLLILLMCTAAAALEPNEILVVVNKDIPSSVELGQYYCQCRNVPKKNMLALNLGKELTDTISREDYNGKIAEPIRKRLSDDKSSREIKCLLTTYGVPYKVGPRKPLADQLELLKPLEENAAQYEKQLADAKANSLPTNEQNKIKRNLVIAQGEIDRIQGKETDASVDSELSMVLFDDYELYRWQPNQLNKKNRFPEEMILTIMVSRLDGPTPQIVRGLIYKAITAETYGLNGVVYIDSRGMPDDKQPNSFAHFDQGIRDLAVLLRFRTNLEVKEEQTNKLFEPGSCPRTAIYCGWYSLRKYVDAFDFVDGAIGYHIASLEATELRNPNSSEWCPSMLTHGVTATLGAVAEPYLEAFPKPEEFFLELIEGKCLVEAFYRTQPFCSWRLVLIGDPLYTPFKKQPGAR